VTPFNNPTYFGVADGIEIDGYLYEEGDVIVLNFQHITSRNEEQSIAIAIDFTTGTRLKTILQDRIQPRGNTNRT
jgi:hypothetical protein